MSELAKCRTRLAIARAVTLEINCPHCGEPQPCGVQSGELERFRAALKESLDAWSSAVEDQRYSSMSTTQDDRIAELRKLIDPHRNSTIWTVAEARAASVAPNDRRNCVSCDGIIIFDVSGKVDLL